MITFTHTDGRLCMFLTYALDSRPEQGLQRAWFYGLPPDLHRCHETHPDPDSLSDDPAAD